MKALSLWEPWASLVRFGVKTIETRSWSTTYRGPIAIASAKTKPKTYAMQVGDYRSVPLGDGRWSLVHAEHGPAGLLTFGAVLATAQLVDVLPILEENERARGIPYVGEDDEGTLRIWRPTSLAGTPLDVGEGWPEAERAFGDYTPGRYAWILADVVPLEEPVPARGRQGLWEWAA
jgi:hypothetical protein